MESRPKTSSVPAAAPLAGIRILDFSRVLAGPFLTQSLAALGAEIVKIEPPGGDPTRHLGPPEFRGASYYFHAANGGKRSVVLDLATESGRAVARRLARESDAIVENFRPGVMARLGLDPIDLRTELPKLVILSISGFGADAPVGERERASFDLTVQARGGSLSLNGWTGGRPVRLGIPMGDLAGAFFGGMALLSALLQRARTGRGEWIDLSLLDAQVALLGTWASLASLSGRSPGPAGSGHPSAMPYDVYDASDGPFALAVFTDRFWPPLCDVVGVPAFANDPRFRSGADRVRHRDEIDAVLRPLFRTRTREEWLGDLRWAGVPVEPVSGVLEALVDPAILHRGAVRWEKVGDSALAQAAFPAAFGGSFGFAGPAPASLGADRDHVLESWLSLSRPEIRSLEDAGAFGRSGAC